MLGRNAVGHEQDEQTLRRWRGLRSGGASELQREGSSEAEPEGLEEQAALEDLRCAEESGIDRH
jgi:hypothetical protein